MNTELILSFLVGSIFGCILAATLMPKFLQSIFRDTARNELSEIDTEISQETIDRQMELGKMMQDLNAQVAQATATWNVSSDKLAHELKGLSESHSKWAHALSNTSEQGALAEESLKVMLETAGFVKGVNFEEQVSQKSEGGNLRPDVFVYTADGGTIIIDSKAPMKLYSEAVESNDKSIKKKKLKEHAKSVLSYAKDLGKKDYSKNSLHKNSTDFVIMYLPNVAVYMSAVEQIPDLVEQAAKHRVMICPPSLVYAALKTIMLTWQQQEVYKNAEKISDQAMVIHERLKKFYNGYFEQIGVHLQRSVKSYNMAVRTWDKRVLPSIRQIESMGVSNDSRKVEDVEIIDIKPMLDEKKDAENG
tara:strand:- start:384 stop:1466 length:1083 start_codon:yes stop_codon:yes gene_type:complete